MAEKVQKHKSANGYAPKKIVAIIIAIALLIISFIIIRPYIAAILTGIFLAYIFYTPYIKLNKFIKKPGVAAAIICIIVLAIAGLVIYFIAQVTIKEAFSLYMSIQELDIFDIINTALTNVFHVAPELSKQIGVTLQQSAISLTNTVINSIGRILTNAPKLIIQFFIVLFVFFYFLKEGKKSITYIKQILPFSSETNERFIKRSKQVAKATIAGQIAVGAVQGILAGILFYIFKAPSPLFFALLATFCGILPFIGPWLVIVPVGLMLIASGSYIPGILLIIIGVVINTVAGEPLRALIIGKRGKSNPAVILIGMLGGLALIGPIGLVAGPLILESMILFINIYRTGRMH